MEHVDNDDGQEIVVLIQSVPLQLCDIAFVESMKDMNVRIIVGGGDIFVEG